MFKKSPEQSQSREITPDTNKTLETFMENRQKIPLSERAFQAIAEQDLEFKESKDFLEKIRQLKELIRQKVEQITADKKQSGIYNLYYNLGESVMWDENIYKLIKNLQLDKNKILWNACFSQKDEEDNLNRESLIIFKNLLEQTQNTRAYPYPLLSVGEVAFCLSNLEVIDTPYPNLQALELHNYDVLKIIKDLPIFAQMQDLRELLKTVEEKEFAYDSKQPFLKTLPAITQEREYDDESTKKLIKQFLMLNKSEKDFGIKSANEESAEAWASEYANYFSGDLKIPIKELYKKDYQPPAETAKPQKNKKIKEKKEFIFWQNWKKTIKPLVIPIGLAAGIGLFGWWGARQVAKEIKRPAQQTETDKGERPKKETASGYTPNCEQDPFEKGVPIMQLSTTKKKSYYIYDTLYNDISDNMLREMDPETILHSNKEVNYSTPMILLTDPHKADVPKLDMEKIDKNYLTDLLKRGKIPFVANCIPETIILYNNTTKIFHELIEDLHIVDGKIINFNSIDLNKINHVVIWSQKYLNPQFNIPLQSVSDPITEQVNLPPKFEKKFQEIINTNWSDRAKVEKIIDLVKGSFIYGGGTKVANTYQKAKGRNFMEKAFKVKIVDCDVENAILLKLLRDAGIPSVMATGALTKDDMVYSDELHGYCFAYYQDQQGIERWHIADATSDPPFTQQLKEALTNWRNLKDFFLKQDELNVSKEKMTGKAILTSIIAYLVILVSQAMISYYSRRRACDQIEEEINFTVNLVQEEINHLSLPIQKKEKVKEYIRQAFGRQLGELSYYGDTDNSKFVSFGGGLLPFFGPLALWAKRSAWKRQMTKKINDYEELTEEYIEQIKKGEIFCAELIKMIEDSGKGILPFNKPQTLEKYKEYYREMWRKEQEKRGMGFTVITKEAEQKIGEQAEARFKKDHNYWDEIIEGLKILLTEKTTLPPSPADVVDFPKKKDPDKIFSPALKISPKDYYCLYLELSNFADDLCANNEPYYLLAANYIKAALGEVSLAQLMGDLAKLHLVAKNKDLLPDNPKDYPKDLNSLIKLCHQVIEEKSVKTDYV